MAAPLFCAKQSFRCVADRKAAPLKAAQGQAQIDQLYLCGGGVQVSVWQLFSRARLRQCLFQDLVVNPTNLQPRAVGKMHLARTDSIPFNSLDRFDPDNRRSMNPDELGWIQPAQNSPDGVAEQVVARIGVQADIIIVSGDPVDRFNRHS
jgi:hypothetical protein